MDLGGVHVGSVTNELFWLRMLKMGETLHYVRAENIWDIFIPYPQLDLDLDCCQSKTA